MALVLSVFWAGMSVSQTQTMCRDRRRQSVCLSASGICVCQSLVVSGETGYRGIRRRHSSVCLFLARKSAVQPRAMSGREDTSQAASLEVGRVKADLGSLLGRSIS